MTVNSGPQLAGHLVVRCLIEQGVTHVFGVPGESYLAALDGFHEYADRIRFVPNRQEGGAAYMAEAVGKLTGRPGVCFVTRGPGATNACIGVHTAFQDSTPMVLLIGDVATDARDREAFQEVDFSAMFGPLAKSVQRIDDPERIPEYVQRAFATAMNGRPGPAVLVLPEDMLTKPTTAQPLPRVDPVRGGVEAQRLIELSERLRHAAKPLMILGGGGWTAEACRDVEAFAHQWGLPVACAFRFQDLFDNRDDHYVGDVGLGIAPHLAVAIREADVLLVLGARLGESTSSGYTLVPIGESREGLIHVHADPEELYRVYTPSLALCSGMPAMAAALVELQPPELCTWADWRNGLRQAFEKHASPVASRRETPGGVDMFAVMEHVRAHLPQDTVCTNGAGNFATWLHRFYPLPGWARGQRTQLAPTNGSMGYGAPAGIAASIVSGRPVLTFVGDGDFLMNGQELATATAMGARMVIVLVNNAMYGTIRMHQEREFPARLAGSTLHNPDFVGLARAYGFGATRVTQTEQFERAWSEAWSASGGYLIELVIDPQVITPRLTLDEIREAGRK